MNNRERRAEKGFTLIEVLIAVALVSAIFVIVAGALQFSVRAWRNTEASLTAVRDVAFAQSILRRTLESAYPRLAGDDRIDFVGDATGVRFVAETPNALDAPVRSRIAIRSVASEDGVAVVIEITPEFSDTRVEETLIEGMSSVSFSYLPRRRDGAGAPEWTDRWAGEARPPALVKIEAQPAKDDRRRWPALIIALKTDVDAACRYDPLTNFCRGRRQ